MLAETVADTDGQTLGILKYKIVISLEHCTMHSRYWFVQDQVQVFSAFCF